MNNGMFIPNIPIGYGMPTFTGINPNLASGLGVARNLGLSRGLGGLSGKAGLFRSVNWGGLLNNASKALGVVNLLKAKDLGDAQADVLIEKYGK